MPRFVWGVIATAAALATLAIAATPVAATGDRAEYVAQVDPICAATNNAERRTLRGVGRDLGRGRNRQAARKFARTTRVFAAGVEQVAAVPPPAVDAALIAQWIGMLREQIPRARQVVKVLRRDARTAAVKQALRRLYSLSYRTQLVVIDYGFTSCQEL